MAGNENNIEKVADLLIAAQPEPQEHTIASERFEGQDANGASDYSERWPKDKLGREFDPALHVIGPDGNPRLNSDGTLRRRKLHGQGEYAPRAPLVSIEAQTCGSAIAQLIFMSCAQLGGDAFAPSDTDRDAVTSAWSVWCQARGIIDIPPTLGVFLAMTIYLGPRLSTPEVKAGIRERWQRVRLWWRNRTGRQ